MNGISSGVLISLGAYFLVMIGIGIYAYFKQANDTEGYMLGGRNLGPQSLHYQQGRRTCQVGCSLAYQAICMPMVS